MAHPRGIVLALCLIGWPCVAHGADDQKISEIKVRVDDTYVKKVLGTKLGTLLPSQLQESENPLCRAAAVLVAQEAADGYGYWTTFVDLLKETAKGVKEGADLAGAKTVSKVAQLAGTIVEAFEQEEPAAALGQALVTESSDWLIGKAPKSGNESLDDAAKKQAEKARDKLVDALFPGTKRKATTYHSKVGDCSVDVTPEWQWPGPKQIGGIRLYISGDCQCKKPLKLNRGIPTNFGGQPDQIKSCGLGRFAIIVFLPMERMETSVSFGGTPINLKKYLETGSKLKSAIKDAIDGKKSEEDPREIAKDLQKQTDKISSVKAELVLRPIFATQYRLEELKVLDCGECPSDRTTTGQPNQPAPEAPPPANVPEDICSGRCGKLYVAWIQALQEAAAPDPLAQGLDKDIAAAKRDLESAERARDDLRPGLDKANAKVDGYRAQAKEKGFALTDLGDLWTRALEAQRIAQSSYDAKKALAETKAGELAKLEGEAAKAAARQREKDQKAEAAKAAYYECARSCWDQARQADPKVDVPKDVQKWADEHPRKAIGDGRSTGEKKVGRPRLGGRLHLGGSIGLHNVDDQATVGAEADVEIDPHWAAFLGIHVLAGSNNTVPMVFVGGQYSFALPLHFSIGVRLAVGYAPFVFHAGSATVTLHHGLILPEGEVAYHINGRWFVGLTPISFPVFFSAGFVGAAYQVRAFGGALF